MRIRQAEHVFDAPWDLVVRAQFRKYPNEFNNAVEGVDVVERRVDKTGTLYSHRLLSTRWGLPGWATKILGACGHAHASEHSFVFPSIRLMVLETKNLTFCNIITVDEKMTYRPHPEDKNKTVLHQESVVNVQGVPLSSYIEHYVIDNIATNAEKGKKAMVSVMEKIQKESLELQHGAQKTMEEAFQKLHFNERSPF
ncbi:PRELI domain containing protein 3B-like isoform X2 [Dreissena polymorpha]|uniref:PRELI domain containing protein 3B-like isoform X2 n=1 Tax=Dreissena polymorpha TaxID=45954 RepID=UPI00226474A4|nr:PRELI domain containing protein 3B-like isoform X2 [Dreissena polymorpha]